MSRPDQRVACVVVHVHTLAVEDGVAECGRVVLCCHVWTCSFESSRHALVTTGVGESKVLCAWWHLVVCLFAYLCVFCDAV
eukprot:m.514386 g.514386  ORF g.514386 m.514386 type:complete len:81 (-) comp112954_c0_seq1:128-370(-)